MLIVNINTLITQRTIYCNISLYFILGALMYCFFSNICANVVFRLTAQTHKGKYNVCYIHTHMPFNWMQNFLHPLCRFYLLLLFIPCLVVFNLL